MRRFLVANPIQKDDVSKYHFSDKACEAIANLRLEGIVVDDEMLKEFKQVDLNQISPEDYIQNIKAKYKNS